MEKPTPTSAREQPKRGRRTLNAHSCAPESSSSARSPQDVPAGEHATGRIAQRKASTARSSGSTSSSTSSEAGKATERTDAVAVVNASVTQLPAPPAGSATVTEGDGNVHPSSQEPSHHESASTIAAAKSGSLLRKPSTSGARQQLQPRDVQEASDKEAQVVRSERSNDISRRHGSFCRVTPSALRALRNAVALTDRRPSLAPAVIAAAFAARSSGFERRASRERSKHAYHTHSAQCSAVSVFYSLTALVMMAALLVLVYILSQLLYNRKDSPRATCMNHVCREYARRLLDSLNRSVDPCHSFTRFVCDGWRQRQLLSVRELIFSAATERILRVVNTMDVPLSGQSLLQRATKLYRSCTALMLDRSNELVKVKAALREAGVTWPHQPSSGSRRDLLRMLFHCDYALGWSTVFRVELKLHRNSTKAYVLTDSGFHIIARRCREMNDYNRLKYFTFLRDSFRDVHEGQQVEAQEDIVTLEDTKALEDKMFGPLATTFHSNAPQLMTVPAAVVYSAAVNLSLDRWTAVFKQEGVEVRGLLVFLTWNLPFFSTFVRLWARYGERDMYAYVSWCTVQLAALFANSELVKNFYEPPQRALFSHGVFCLSRTYMGSGKPLLTSYGREVLPAVVRPAAESLSLGVRVAFKKRLSAWADYNDSVAVIRSWESSCAMFSIIVPRPKTNFTDVVVGNMGDSFLRNWRNAWLSRTQFRDADIKVAVTAIDTLAFTADDDYSEDFILLPYVLTFPLYDVHALPAINFGGLGSKVALAVARKFYNTYASAGAGGSSFGAFRSCLANDSVGGEQGDLASLFAEVVSLGALVDALRNVSGDSHIVHLERMTSEQLLFVATCYAKCTGGYYNFDESLCNAALRNVPEFADAFRCPPGTPMNPRHRCRLF